MHAFSDDDEPAGTAGKLILNVDYATQVTLDISLAATQAELFAHQFINETAEGAIVRLTSGEK